MVGLSLRPGLRAPGAFLTPVCLGLELWAFQPAWESGRTMSSCPVPSLDSCSPDNLKPLSGWCLPSQAEDIYLKSTLCRLSPEFFSAQKHQIPGQWSGCLFLRPQFPWSAPLLRSFLVKHLSDPFLIFGSGSVTPRSHKSQAFCHFSLGLSVGTPSCTLTPQPSASSLATCCNFSALVPHFPLSF